MICAGASSRFRRAEQVATTTAMTLFNLLGINVVLHAGVDLDDFNVESFDGILLLGDELARARLECAGAPRSSGHADWLCAAAAGDLPAWP